MESERRDEPGGSRHTTLGNLGPLGLQRGNPPASAAVEKQRRVNYTYQGQKLSRRFVSSSPVTFTKAPEHEDLDLDPAQTGVDECSPGDRAGLFIITNRATVLQGGKQTPNYLFKTILLISFK